MKSELGFVTGICLLLASPIKTEPLNIENSFLEARLNSLNGTYQAGIPELPWDPIVDLLFNFITPYGPGVSKECSDSSIAYKDALNNPFTYTGFGQDLKWSTKMLDASAKLPKTGMLKGRRHFPGNMDSCLEIKAVASDLEFTGKHCLLRLMPDEMLDKKREARLSPGDLSIFTSELYGFWLMGRCIPSTCSMNDVDVGFVNFINDLSEWLESNDLTGIKLPNMTFKALNCHTEDEGVKLEAGDFGYIAVLVFFGILVTVGTISDVLLNIFHLDFQSEKFVQIVQGFSAYTNTLAVFNTDTVMPDSLESINGIRFLSITWVIVGHCYNMYAPYGVALIQNPKDFFGDSYLGNPLFAAVVNSFPSVDTFFLIGATLLAYSTMKELDKNNGGGIKFWALFYFHRFVRLTGVYAMVVGFHATLLKYFTHGTSSYVMENNIQSCQEMGWKNLVYINNLLWDDTKNCMSHSWYLAMDMQFFIISPFIIFTMWKFPKVGSIFAGLLTLLATVLPLTLSWINEYPASPMFDTGDIASDYMKHFYLVPWTRFQPYIIGLILGFVLYNLKNQNKTKLDLSAVVTAWIWVFAAVTGLAVVYGLVKYQIHFREYEMPVYESAFYNGLHRLAWALSVSWVILACEKGLGGPVNILLSWGAWLPLARLSYGIYLVHRIVIDYYLSLPSYTVQLNHPLVIYFILWVVSMSAAISYVSLVCFEKPIGHLEKLLMTLLGVSRLPSVKTIKRE